MLIDPKQTILPSFFIAAGLAFAFHALAQRLRRRAHIEGNAKETTPIKALGLRRFTLSLSLGIACFIGVNLLRGTFSLPEKYWEYLGVIALTTGLLGPILSAIPGKWKWLSWPLISFATAWLLVPDWSTLEPSRQVYIPLFAIYLSGLGLLYEWGGTRSSPRELLFTLCATTATLAAATAAIASLKYGELGLILFASGAAFFFFSLFARIESDEIAGLLPSAAIMIGGVAFVGYIYPQPPIYELMLLPFAPVGLFAAHKFSNASTMRGTAIRIGGYFAVLLPILIAIFVRYGFE